MVLAWNMSDTSQFAVLNYNECIQTIAVMAQGQCFYSDCAAFQDAKEKYTHVYLMSKQIVADVLKQYLSVKKNKKP